MNIDISSAYKPGDPAPDGYLNWHSWADVQHKAGLRQKQCGMCGLWKFPSELSDKVTTHEATNRRGAVYAWSAPICKKCVAKKEEGGRG